VASHIRSRKSLPEYKICCHEATNLFHLPPTLLLFCLASHSTRMPGKQVRFAPKNTIFTPPSPALSTLSRANSLPSSTPQLHVYTLSPVMSTHSVSKLRPRSALRRTAHPLLMLSDAGKHAPLVYDIRRNPSTMSLYHHPLPTSVLNEPAIYPPLPEITIISPYISSKWSIRVLASNKTYVTVLDLIDTLHRSLRTTVSAAEYQGLPTDKARTRVALAYQERYRALEGHHGYDEEKMGGLKRIDFLMEYTKFLGLSMSVNDEGHSVWVLNVTVGSSS